MRCGGRAHKFEGFVTHLELSRHLWNYVTPNYGGEQQELKAKLLWNDLNSILRVLIRKRDNEPLYLLPKEDLDLTQGFLERLSQPPLRGYY